MRPKHGLLGSGNRPVRSERGTGVGAAELVSRRKVFRRMSPDLRTDGMLRACRIAPENQTMPRQFPTSENDGDAGR